MAYVYRLKYRIGILPLFFSFFSPFTGRAGGLKPERPQPSFEKMRSTPPHSAKIPPRTVSQAWNTSVDALKQIRQTIYGRDYVIHSLTTAILAKEFIWLNGDPGGAKTFISRIMFQSVLNSIPEKDKKIFVLQFHKLVAEGKISGFPKFSKMYKDGKYEIETKTSLVGDQYLFLIADEAEKSNPAALNALLSVLNERKAFLGSKVVNAILSSGVFTSNKTVGEFLLGFLNDRASGEAMVDRMAIKGNVPNQQLTAEERVLMYDLVKNAKKIDATLPLLELEPVVAQVKISNEMKAEIAFLVRELDQYVTKKANESRDAVRKGKALSENFPANQFSTRSVGRLEDVFKAAFIAKQLMEGVSYENLRLTPTREDLVLLAQSALYVGQGAVNFKTFPYKTLAIAGHSNAANPAAPSDSGFKVVSPYGSSLLMSAEYSPYTREILVQDQKGKTAFILTETKEQNWVLKYQSDAFRDWTVDPAELRNIPSQITSLITTHAINLSRPQFEVDQKIPTLIAKGTMKERTRSELTSIQEDLNQWANILNTHFDHDYVPKTVKLEKPLTPKNAKEKKAYRRARLSLQEEQKIALDYEWLSYEVKTLKQRFIEMDHSIEAHLTALLSGNHLLVVGPPGGAKTSLAELIIKAELKMLNASQIDQIVGATLKSMKSDETFLRAVLSRIHAEKPKKFKRFLLQFHKLLPEGVLIGFPKVEKQLDEGIEEIEVSDSLASKEFIFAILDEMDKANPQTLTTLLSLLNEREVFSGSQVIQTALRTAILTSNKMPSELLDSYLNDRSSGEAVLDRTINKVFVSNKLSSEEELIRFLIERDYFKGKAWKGLLGIGGLAPLMEQVEFESPALKDLLANVYDKFSALRIKVEEKTYGDHLKRPMEFPYYYVAPSGNASDRTFIKLLDQLKARFIVHQLMEGVEFKDLRTKMEFKDLRLFFEGLGYWAPQKIQFSYNQEGVLTFHQESPVLDRLIDSGIVDDRVSYHLDKMKDEGRDYVQVLNDEIESFMREYKSEILKYPDLFPSLLIDREKFAGQESTLSAQRASQSPTFTRKARGDAIRDLAALRLQLDLARVEGTPDMILQDLEKAYKNREEELLKSMTPNDLLKKMKREITRQQAQITHIQQEQSTHTKQKERRRFQEQLRQIKNSVIDGTLAIFHRIEPGNFMRGEEGQKVRVSLTKPFEMMATPTTQIIWRRVAELAKQKFPGNYNINENPSRFQGDTHPVESVSYNDVQIWINALNALSKAREPALSDLIPGHKQGDVYRLPTEDEWEFVVRGRGQYNKMFYFGNNISQLGLNAWYKENSRNQTHPVAQKQPLMIGEKEFFDMIGNVKEWVQDRYAESQQGEQRVLRGGSYDDSNVSSQTRSGHFPDDRGRDSVIGFRLAKEVQ